MQIKTSGHDYLKKCYWWKSNRVKDFLRLLRGLPTLESESVCFAECYILMEIYLHLLLHFVTFFCECNTPIYPYPLLLSDHVLMSQLSDKDKNQFEEKRRKNQFTQIISVTLPSLTWHWWSTQNCRHSTTTIRNKESMTWWGTHGWSHTFCNLNKYILQFEQIPFQFEQIQSISSTNPCGLIHWLVGLLGFVNLFNFS